eukprot:CAMPEP_0182459062 /NCGR_PEP_ID=MMETSP1319-20130603/4271_1 /TAXON_ID=172717 /ORGANISM="Bolidomonas pacifica, Strain RCC208" /LENGTH=49 /DNA_ID=CAMNT_0024657891 /DNA_START=38 /DNA_END=187 /DNA_ORIENTATION=-
MSSLLAASQVVLQAHARAGRPSKSAKGTITLHTSSRRTMSVPSVVLLAG